MLIMQRVVDSLNELLKKFKYIKAVETGTIRSFDEKHESTKHIAKTLGDRGDLISIDSSPKAIEVSKKICRKLNNIQWVCSKSTDHLKALKEKFHFALLDSANDPDVIWDEFLLVRPMMVEGGIIMIDDAGISPSGGRDKSNAKKGYKVWDKVENVLPISVVKAPHGTQLKIQV